MRKRNLSIWLSAGFCLFIFSCTTRNNGETYNTDEITYRVGTSKDLGEEVDSIRYLPLLKSDQHLVSEATKLRVKNNRIVIFEKKTHRVVSYDTNGHFLYEINHRGKGNKEYLEIANITVTANYIYLLDNFKHKLNVYDIKDGSFVRSTDVPFVAWDLEAFDDNNLLFTMLENNPNGQVEANGHNYAVWRTDSLGKIIDSYLPYEKGYYEMIGKEVYFTVSGDNTIFHSFMKDGYYTFDSKGILKYTNMNFNRPIPRGTPSPMTMSQRKNINICLRHHMLPTTTCWPKSDKEILVKSNYIITKRRRSSKTLTSPALMRWWTFPVYGGNSSSRLFPI